MSNKNEISTASINHFTKYEYLKCIIHDRCFISRYCLENVEHINWYKLLGIEDNNETKIPKLAYPMVCFTDLPHDKWYLHKQTYGDYVITLTEEWKLRNGLVPVIYLMQGNLLTNNLLTQCLAMARRYCIEHPEQIGIQNFIDMFIPYLKLYSEGSKRYYDEREWRYFPWKSMDGLSMCISEDEFNNIDIKNLRNNELSEKENSKLYFEYEDIVNVEVKKKHEQEIVSKLLVTTFNIEIKSAKQKVSIARL